MILLKFKEKTADENNSGIVKYRTVLVARWSRWFSISFEYQIQDTTGEWRPIRWYDITITRSWLWGASHTYYDGPNCGFSIGPIHLNWKWGWCEKCLAEIE